MPALTPKSEAAMFHEIMEEMRHIRRRLDDHIDTEDARLKELGKDVTHIRTELSSHKTKLSIIAGSIAFAVTSVITYIMGAFDR